jgi:hypothetical protein
VPKSTPGIKKIAGMLYAPVMIANKKAQHVLE